MYAGAVLQGTGRESDDVCANQYGDYLVVKDRVLESTQKSFSHEGGIKKEGTKYNYALVCVSLHDTGGEECTTILESELRDAVVRGLYKWIVRKDWNKISKVFRWD